jgi:hypothetical protein
MELSPNVIIASVVAITVAVLVIRWARRNEAAPPVEPHAPLPSRKTATPLTKDPLVDWLLERAFEQTGVRLADDPLVRNRIADAAAMAVDQLRDGRTVTISLPFLTADEQGPKHFNVELKRNADSTFEQLGG